MKFGSHLYGTSTKDSDTDIKGIALPTWRQVCLGRIPKHIEYSSTGAEYTKNKAGDVDTEIFSLHEFIKLALEGQTVALDMIHAPENMLFEKNNIWDSLQQNRDKFYTRKTTAFIGYAQKQAAKYGVKGSRLNDANAVINFLKTHHEETRLGELFLYEINNFPQGEHIHFGENKNGIKEVIVCGKTMQFTNKIGYCIPILENFVVKYGERARKAANDEGVDWKAISHALRAAYQIKELMLKNTITFPRPEADYLIAVKTGKLKYLDVSQVLESLIDEVKELSPKSNLPEKPDIKFWENWLIDIIESNRD